MTSPAPVVLVFLDPTFPGGRLADASQPQLMVTDQGATRGDGVFETMLAVGGNVRKVQAHPLIPDTVRVGGFVYDVDTGLIDQVV